MWVDGDLKVRRKEAAEWFARLGHRPVSVEDIKAFAEWRNDARNDRAYREVEALWDASKGLASDPEIQALTIEAYARDDSSPKRKDAGRSWRAAGLMGAALLVLGSGLWLIRRPETYVTAVGEQRMVRLDDGSQVTLDTDTRIEVRSESRSRRIVLASGQAHFDVAPDPQRPFVVEAGDAEVTALGTRFDVRRIGDGARVTLVEGRVSVRPAPASRPLELRPGQQVATAAPKPVVREVDASRETGWTTGRLTFDSIPVWAAVDEVNRYSEVKIRLDAAHVRNITISGVFNAGDSEAFVSALADRYELSTVRQPDGSILLKAPDRGAGEDPGNTSSAAS
jgi:transmembrane sensor